MCLAIVADGVGEGRIVASSIDVEESRREAPAPVFAGAAETTQDRSGVVAQALGE